MEGEARAEGRHGRPQSSCRACPGIHCAAHPWAAGNAARWTPGQARGDARWGGL